MTVKEQISIILSVLKDWRVIVTAVAMILVIAFVKFITTYRKKPKAPKITKPAAAAAPAGEKKEDSGPKNDISEKDV